MVHLTTSGKILGMLLLPFPLLLFISIGEQLSCLIDTSDKDLLVKVGSKNVPFVSKKRTEVMHNKRGPSN